MGEEYKIKAQPTTIKFCSRASVKIKDSFFTLEYGEERKLPETDYDLEKEIQDLTIHCNTVVDNQIQDIINSQI